MGIRRVVTGHSPTGKSVIASDDVVEPVTVSLTPGYEFFKMWGADTLPALPDAGKEPSHPAYFPTAGGFRFGLFTVPPESVIAPGDVDFEAAVVEIETKLPGMSAYMEAENPGMHTTASVDYEYVISGQVILELDDGVEVTLNPGDTVVQNGTRHAWRNRGTEPCRMVVVLVGAPHANVPH